MRIHNNSIIFGVVAVLGTVLLLSGCAQPGTTLSLIDIQSEIDQAVAATVQAISGSGSSQSAPELPSHTPTEVLATHTPLPTASPTPTATQTPISSQPTNTPLMTATATTQVSGEPVIWADVNTNCRLGPSRRYKVDGYLLISDESTVHGYDAGENWWYIANPQKDEQFCWVWRETTNVEGSTSSLPVITPSPMPPAKSSYYNCCGYYNPCGCPIIMKVEKNGKVKWVKSENCSCNKTVVCKTTVNCYIKKCNNCCWWDPNKVHKIYINH
jgi:hypothetical protein